MQHQRLSDKELLRLNHVENIPSLVDLKNPLDSVNPSEEKHYSVVLGFHLMSPLCPVPKQSLW